MDQAGSSGLPGRYALGSAVRDAARFWEPRRIAYNLLLAAIVIGWLVLTWPHFQPAFTIENLFRLLVLALIANLFYTSVYLADVPLELSSIQRLWRRWRWILWVLGMLFAMLVTFYWIGDEIYPYVH